MRTTYKLLTAAEIRGGIPEHPDITEAITPWPHKPNTQFHAHRNCVGVLGTEHRPSPCTHHVPEEVMALAIAEAECVGIEYMALGKPAGSIFNPEHWMYESIRDQFGDLDIVSRGARLNLNRLQRSGFP